MFIQNVDEKGVPAGYEMFTSQVIFPAETDQVTTMLSNLHHSCFKKIHQDFSAINTTKSIKFGLKIIPIYLTSIINFNYSIPFSSFHNTTK
jgi:hypothetical protein